MTEPNAVRENGRRKYEICRKGSRDCIMRCAPNAMDTDTVRDVGREKKYNCRVHFEGRRKRER